MLISHDELKRLLHYDPETGVWTRLISRRGDKVGTRADYLHSVYGYYRVRIKEQSYFAHRLAWFYMTGEWPPADTEHRDRVRANNKWENLRLAARWQNIHNKKGRKNKCKGVSYIKKLGRYRAQICVQGRKHSLGYAETEEAAYELYKTAAQKLVGEFICVE